MFIGGGTLLKIEIRSSFIGILIFLSSSWSQPTVAASLSPCHGLIFLASQNKTAISDRITIQRYFELFEDTHGPPDQTLDTSPNASHPSTSPMDLIVRTELPSQEAFDQIFSGMRKVQKAIRSGNNNWILFINFYLI